jgi:hypothetical protein
MIKFYILHMIISYPNLLEIVKLQKKTKMKGFFFFSIFQINMSNYNNLISKILSPLVVSNFFQIYS